MADGVFGVSLREYRLRAGWTQDELADRSGVSAHSISVLEAGRRHPRLSSVARLATALKLDQDAREQLIAAARAGAPADTGGPAAPAPRLGATPADSTARAAQLSADLSDFTGRAPLVERLEALLTRTSAEPAGGPVVLSAIDGAGGVGKTSLAVHVAHRVLRHFPDGQLQADLHGVGGPPSDPSTVLARFLRGLGIPPEKIPADPEERGALYRSTLAGRRILVLLDNAQHAAQVRPLLPGSGTCSVLITSRSALPGLDGACRLTLDVLDGDEALALFTRIVGTDVVEAEPEAAAAVLRVCAGLPLAIRIAASRLVARPGWSVGDLAGRLGDERHRLSELAVEDRAVRATFAVSYRNLPPDEAHAFRLLGLCEGPSVSLPAAAALLALPLSAAEQILDALSDIHLLQSLGGGRYRLHDLLRVYAAECADLAEPQAAQHAATHRLLSWYLHTSAAASRVLNPSRRHVVLDAPDPLWRPLDFAGYDHALSWAERERTNLVAAVAQAARTGRHEIGWKLPITMWDLFNLRRQHADGIDCYELALSSARALGDLEATAWALNSLSSEYRPAGRLAEAARCLHQALAIRSRLGDVRGEASCLINLGLLHIEMGRAAEAVGLLDRALGIFRRLGLRYGEAGAHTNLGEAHKHLGNPAIALGHYEQALTIHREGSDQFLIGRALTNLAETLCLLGRLDEAAEQAAQGHATCREAGNRIDEAVALDVLGRVHAARGQRSPAVQHWRAAQAIFADLGDARAAAVGARLRQ